MLVYFVGLVILVLLLSGGGYLLLQGTIDHRRITERDAKGYFMVWMFIVTFISVSVAYFAAPHIDPEVVAEGIQQSTAGMFVVTALCIAVLAVGLIKLKEKQQFL
ncbi:hypothetical protein [Gynuella sp.]|uniref:hypothetical protein n=1 Tax=Gynuella sp. TaxID=2969146 RepID=UPI003D148AE0